jgi:predicted 2-oxoglutarate/Fe(II)-dependent dioxygenase YbiX
MKNNVETMKLKLQRLFSVEECNDIVNYFETDESEWGYVEINNDAKYYIKEINKTDKTHNFIKGKFENFIQNEFFLSVNCINVSILKYLPTFKFERHKDRDHEKEFNHDFVFNINVILNDNYVGGEFLLNDSLVEGNTSGMVYYYNSIQYHEVKPIISGVRYSMICYIRERDFKNKKIKSLI